MLVSLLLGLLTSRAEDLEYELELGGGLGTGFYLGDVNSTPFAHLGGMIWGFALLWWWKKQRKIYGCKQFALHPSFAPKRKIKKVLTLCILGCIMMTF